MLSRKFSMVCLCLAASLWFSGLALAASGDYATSFAEIEKLSSRQFNTGIGRRITAIHDLKAKGGTEKAAAAADADAPYTTPSDQPVVTLDLPMPDPIFLGSSQAYPSASLTNCNDDPYVRMWASAYGGWTNQRNKGGKEGYNYDEEGFIFGYDMQHGDVTLGLAAALGSGELETKSKQTNTEVDTLQIGAYWSYDPVEGIFADLNVGAGYSWNRTNSSLLTGGNRNGKFHASSLFAGGNIGYTYTWDDLLRVTPTIGLHWTQVHQNSWSEKSTPDTGYHFDKVDNNYFEIPLAVRVSKGYELTNGSIITPELRAAIIFEVGDSTPTVRVGEAGSSNTATLHGIDPGFGRGLIGGGVKANINACMDAFVDYNLEIRSGYRNSSLTTGVGFAF